MSRHETKPALRMEKKDFPVKKQIDINLSEIRALCAFAHDVMFPHARSNCASEPKLNVILGLFNRIWLCANSALHLNSLDHYQAIGAAARTVFELLVDLKTLSLDVSGEMLERYLEHSKLQQIYWASQTIEYDASNPGILQIPSSAFSDAIGWINNADERACLESSLRKYWKCTKGELKNIPRIRHWSGENSIRALCRLLDKKRTRENEFRFESVYVQTYSFLCWTVHSGVSGSVIGNQEIIETSVFLSLANLMDCFFQATPLVAFEMGLPDTPLKLNNLYDELDRIKTTL